MTVTPFERKLLATLRDFQHSTVSYRSVAKCLWPDSPSWKKYYNSGGYGAPMAQRAGSAVRRLAAKGLVRLQPTHDHHHKVLLTAEGKKALGPDILEAKA